MRGPITPVCRAGVPCSGPAADVTLTFTGAGVVRTTTTDDHGRYRIELPPGTYTVRTNSKPFGQTPRPATTRVRAGRSQQIDLTIATGIA